MNYFAIHNANIIWEKSTTHIIMYLYLLFLPIMYVRHVVKAHMLVNAFL